jgi:hypothetical protein
VLGTAYSAVLFANPLQNCPCMIATESSARRGGDIRSIDQVFMKSAMRRTAVRTEQRSQPLECAPVPPHTDLSSSPSPHRRLAAISCGATNGAALSMQSRLSLQHIRGAHEPCYIVGDILFPGIPRAATTTPAAACAQRRRSGAVCSPGAVADKRGCGSDDHLGAVAEV